MDFELTAGQKRMIRRFEDFADRNFDKRSVAQWQRDQGVPDDVCRGFVDLYTEYASLDASEDNHDLTMTQVLICETLTRSSGAAMPFYTDLLNLLIMQQFSDKDRFRPLLKEYRETGRLPLAFAITEPSAGSDTMSMQCNVSNVEGQLLMNGSKSFVVNGEYAPNLMVVAIDKTAPEQGKYPPLSFWFIPRDLPGISAYPVPKIGQNMLPFANLVFENVPLEERFRLHSDDYVGFPQLFHLLEIGRIMVCSISLGLAEAALDDAARYAKRRVAFGHRIADFQQIDQMIVDMQVKIENMRAMTYKAAWNVDRHGDDRRLTTALAKRYVPRAATEVASDALQILGGRGYTEDERVSGIWRDCRGNQISEGTDEIMVRIAAPLILDRYDEE